MGRLTRFRCCRDRRIQREFKHIVIALSLILATVPAVGFAQGGDGQDAGTSNARVHIVVGGATGDGPPCTCARVHVVIFGREGNRDPGTAGRQPASGIVQQAVSRLAPRIPAKVVRSAVAVAFAWRSEETRDGGRDAGCGLNHW